MSRPPIPVSPTSSSSGLVSRGGARDESSRDPVTVEEAREIGVGMLGYAFMGKAHANAFRKIAYVTCPPPLMPRLIAIAGRNEAAVAAAARRYGFERWATEWQGAVAGPRHGPLRKPRPDHKATA